MQDIDVVELPTEVEHPVAAANDRVVEDVVGEANAGTQVEVASLPQVVNRLASRREELRRGATWEDQGASDVVLIVGDFEQVVPKAEVDGQLDETFQSSCE